MDRGSWWATVHGVTKSQTQLSDFHFTATLLLGFPGGANGKEPAYQCRRHKNSLLTAKLVGCRLGSFEGHSPLFG